MQKKIKFSRLTFPFIGDKLYLFLTIVACTLQNNITAQKYASIQRLLNYNISISHLPGEYSIKTTILIITTNNTKVIITNPKIAYSKARRDTVSFQLNKTTSVEIRLYVNNKMVDTIFTGTYIFDKVSNLPVVCLKLNRENFDCPTGILGGGLRKKEPPDSGFVQYGPVWYKKSIPVFMEYFEGGALVLGEMFKVKPFGGMTLGMPEKSLRIFADSTIGPKKIKASPFMNKKHEAYRSLVLRTSGNDQQYTRIKDVTLSSIARDLKLDYLDYRPSVLYINGDYWGIYNIREKCNLEYLKYNHGASKTNKTTLIQGGGGGQEYQSMVSYLGRAFKEKAAIDSVNKKIILENYIDYIILQIHIQGIDSRGNVRYWKSTDLDNRWRWVFYDSDLSCSKSQVGFNYLAKRISPVATNWYNPTWATVILRNLLTHKEIKNFFINEYCFLLGTRMHADTLQNRVKYFAGLIRPEIPNHVTRRNKISKQSIAGWENQISLFKDFFLLRDETALQHLKSTFNLKGVPTTVKISCNIPNINVLHLRYSSYAFNHAAARFFPGTLVQFEATTLDPKYRFLYWTRPTKDSLLICSIDPGKTTLITAIYMRKPNSPFMGKLACNMVYLKKSKKDTLFIICLENSGANIVGPINLVVKCSKELTELNLKIPELKQGEFIYFTNDVTRAKEIGKLGQYQTVLFPSDFKFKNREWVILDAFDQIVDSILINNPDTALKKKKDGEYFRDSSSGLWTAENKSLLLNKLPATSSIASSTIRFGYWGGGLVLIFIFILFRLKRKAVGVLVCAILILCEGGYSQTLFPDRFGLDSVQTKLVDNKGKGCDSLTGCRNVRVVLKNLLYRGGNNSVPVQNPLSLETINELKNLQFNNIIYLYNKNFESYFPIERLDSLSKQGINYQCSPSLDSIYVYKFLLSIQQSAGEKQPSLTYIHCWNGWHQSGWLSAMTLMQFCGFSPELALKYWIQNTDKNDVGYPRVKKSILEYKPYPNLKFTVEQQKKHCPCIDEAKLDSLIAIEAIQKIKNKESSYPKFHIVRKNDTLGKIAIKYSTTVNSLCKKNNIKKTGLLKIGQKIKI